MSRTEIQQTTQEQLQRIKANLDKFDSLRKKVVNTTAERLEKKMEDFKQKSKALEEKYRDYENSDQIDWSILDKSMKNVADSIEREVQKISEQLS